MVKELVFRRSIQTRGGILVMCNTADDTGECQQCQQVREDHQCVEQVREVPDQIHFQRRTKDDKRNNQQCIDLGGFLAEERLEINFAKEIPADDGGESEEQHADRDENVAEVAECAAECSLCQCSTLQATADFQATRGQNDESGQRQHDESVDENTHHCDDTLLFGILDLGQCMGVRRRTHTGFIGEQAAGNTVTHGLPHADAAGGAKECLGVKSTDKNGFQCGQQCGVVDEQNCNTADDIENCHDRDDLFGERGNSLNTADENETGDDCTGNTDCERGNVEGSAAGVANRVGLNHVTGET